MITVKTKIQTGITKVSARISNAEYLSEDQIDFLSGLISKTLEKDGFSKTSDAANTFEKFSKENDYTEPENQNLDFLDFEHSETFEDRESKRIRNLFPKEYLKY